MLEFDPPTQSLIMILVFSFLDTYYFLYGKISFHKKQITQDTNHLKYKKFRS